MSEYDVNRRQILTTKVDPRSVGDSLLALCTAHYFIIIWKILTDCNDKNVQPFVRI